MSLPAGTVTFLFTDVEGSTRLLQQLGDDYADTLAEHRRALREAFNRHGGVEVDTQGDAFFVAFARASDALAAAHEGQAALREPIRVRMGLHTGEPLVTDEGYVGMDVHRAARIAAVGHGGQVLVSQSTRDLVGGDALRDLGEHRLKDLTAPERIYQLGDGEFPPLKTLDQTNLPIPATPFVGRERELTEVTELLARDDVRLLTLTGPGGTGKTRLALQAVAAAADAYDAGVWWVPLAPVRGSELVLPTAAQALGGGELAAQISDRRLLLLLDNFEHVIEAANDLGDVLAECPRLDVVVTSRTPLRLASEWDYAVDPLPEDESAELFLQRARAARRDFVGDGAVHEICTRLDHLPLAIELAAARARMLDAPELLERLDRRLPILKGGARDAPERQRTLRATIEWSYDLLRPEEQRLFARLGVFAGGFTLDAAEEICGAGFDDIETLLEHSLVRRWQAGRLGMLATIHEYASELLAEVDDEQDVRRRHAEYFLHLAQDAHLSLDAIGAPQRHDLVLPEQHNLRAAIDWTTENDVELGLRLAIALENFWVTQDPNEGARRFTALLAHAEGIDVPLLARAMRDYGGAVDMMNEIEEAERAYAESARLFREAGDESGAAEADFRLGINAYHRGDGARARQLFEASLRTFERFDDDARTLQVLGSLGTLEFEGGNFDRGWELTERSCAMARAAGWTWWEVLSLTSLAERTLEVGRIDEAERRILDPLERGRRMGDRWTKIRGILVMARVALERGDVERAAMLWAVVEDEHARAPIPRWHRLQARYAGHLSHLARPTEVPTLDAAVELVLEDAHD